MPFSPARLTRKGLGLLSNFPTERRFHGSRATGAGSGTARVLWQYRAALATRDRGAPPHCLGHIGYAVVPWKQRRGYATRALHELLRDAKAEGLRYVVITTAPDNVASQRVIEANGGVFVEEFITPSALGGRPALRYRVNLLEDF